MDGGEQGAKATDEKEVFICVRETEVDEIFFDALSSACAKGGGRNGHGKGQATASDLIVRRLSAQDPALATKLRTTTRPLTSVKVDHLRRWIARNCAHYWRTVQMMRNYHPLSR